MTLQPDLQVTVLELCRQHARGLNLSPAAQSFLDFSLAEALSDLDAFFQGLQALPKVGEVTFERVCRVIRSELERQSGHLSDLDAASPEDRKILDLMQRARQQLYDGGSHRFHARQHPAAMSAGDFISDRLLQKIREAGEFTLIATSLPDFIKTPAIWRAEHPLSGPDQAYERRMQLFRETSDLEGVRGDVFVNRDALTMLVTRRGKYAVLSEDDVVEQIGLICSVREPYADRIGLWVADYQSARLSCGALVPASHVFLYLFGGYTEVDDTRLYSDFAVRVDAAKRRAQRFDQAIARFPGLAERLAEPRLASRGGLPPGRRMA